MHSHLLRKTFVGLALAGIITGSFYTVYSASAAARPYLGVRLAAVATDAGESGLAIGDVNKGGPADQAGLKKGDRIIMAGGKAMRSYEDLNTLLAGCKPGDEVEFQVLRGGTEQSARVRLGTPPANPVVAVQPPSAFLGVLTETLTAEHRKQLGVTAEHGTVVTHVLPGSPAAAAGLKRGDVITHVGTTAVKTQGDLRDAIHKAGAGTEVALKVARAAQDLVIKARPQPAPAEIDLPGLLPELHNGRGQLNGDGPLRSLEQLPALESRVRELEQRVRELEQKLRK